MPIRADCEQTASLENNTGVVFERIDFFLDQGQSIYSLILFRLLTTTEYTRRTIRLLPLHSLSHRPCLKVNNRC